MSWHQELPDLTDCFQDTVLVWTPSAFLLFFSSFHIYSIWNKSQEKGQLVPWTTVSCVRVSLAFLLMVVAGIELIAGIIGASEGNAAPVRYVTPIVKLLTFSLVAGLMFSGRKVGADSSAVLFLFWLIYGLMSLFSFYSLTKRFVRSHVSPSCLTIKQRTAL